MSKAMTTRARHGLTLIEMLLVLAIVLVLAALVVPQFAGRSQQARETAAKADIATIETALSAFEIDNGRFPTSQEGLGALIQQPSGVSNWRGPYLRRGLPRDPWGNAYVYRYPGQRNPEGYDVYSLGPEGREGGDVIGNWD